jgi:Protein of unknown function (DUF1553)/Protein of unknown function (DUF1549)
MNARLLVAQSLAVVLLAATVATAQPYSNKPPSASSPQQLAEKIDQQLAQRWAETKTEPAARADDAEFLRRIYLDLAGRVPSAEETRTFLADKHTDKRMRQVDKLLAGPRYVTHFTNVWRAALLPEANNNFLVQAQQGGFEEWLKQELARNVGYDQMVRDLLTAKVGGGGTGVFALAEGFGGGPSPTVYYLAKELKPENLAAGTARVFLGVSVECAQCHNHPFADWKREQFWGMAAFYSGIKSQRLMDFLLPAGDETDKHELTLPGTDKVIQARFLDGTQPTWKEGTGSRATLADWITAKDNPYFARAGANRLWAYFFGTGLVEPVDEMVGANSSSSHPRLLDLLAHEFAEHDFDMKFLIRAITATKAYQLTSASSHKSQDERTLFARMPLRGLTGEQLFDSLATATGYRDAGPTNGGLLSALGGTRSARGEFLARFTSIERPTDTQTSILQALALMNGKVTATVTTVERSETLAAVVDAPFLATAQRIETLYLAALSRKPSAKELDRAQTFVQNAVANAKGQDADARDKANSDALADLFWALLNSPEFILNH